MKEDLKNYLLQLMSFIGIYYFQKNGTEACYWLEWITGLKTLPKKKKEIYLRRRNVPVDSKFKKILFGLYGLFIIRIFQRGKGHHKLIKALLILLFEIYTWS